MLKACIKKISESAYVKTSARQAAGSKRIDYFIEKNGFLPSQE